MSGDAAPSLPRAFVGGGVVATLALFPLLNGLSSRPVWLQWTWFDNAETLAAWAAAAAVIGFTTWLPARYGWRRTADAINAAWLCVSGLMAAGAVVKASVVKGFFDAYRSSASVVIALVGLAVLAAAAWLIVHPGPRRRTRLQRLTGAAWPVMLLLGYNLCVGPGAAVAQRATFSPAPKQAGGVVQHAAAPAADKSAKRTVVLLFDELSPDYLFGDRAIDLARYPALAQLRSRGEIHRDAHLAGGATRYAIPALFGATPEAPEGIVKALHDQGRSVRVWGWYHDYCVGLALAADVCHSTSIYTLRTLHGGFSLVDPWWTDLNLMPSDRPFDAIKVPVAAAFHRQTLDAANRWLKSQLADPAADFIYVHVNVPHLPLLDAPGAPAEAHPFVMDEAGYLRQFGNIDAVVANVLASDTRPTQLIVLSDHNARPLFPKAQHDHVVFIVLQPGGSGSSITEREDAARSVARLSLQGAPR